MIRRAFTMKLKPGASEEYIAHHDSIPEKWPKLVEEIRASGIAQITTFQNGLDLFLYSEISNEEAWNRLWNSEIHREWALLMEPLMHLDENGIVQAGELKQIFHCEPNPGS
jgi:L-rhamnose mutarotase